LPDLKARLRGSGEGAKAGLLAGEDIVSARDFANKLPKLTR
jgi:hypothetical protein